jgi:hypothetical protein
MRHAKRMLLIPEDVYQSLMNMQTSGVRHLPTTSTTNTALQYTAAKATGYRDGHSATGAAAADLLNDDERLLHYQQEYKRYSKLLQEEQERPLPVNVNGLQGATSSVLRAIEDVGKQVAGTNTTTTTASASASTPAVANTTTTTTKGFPVKKKPKVRIRTVRKRGVVVAPLARSATSSASYHTGSRHSSASVENDDDDDDTAANTTHGADESQAAEKEEHIAEEGNSSGNTASKEVVTGQRTRQQQQQKHLEQCRQETLAYISRHPGRLGVTADMQVLRLMHGQYRPVRGSNAEQLINYHFSADRAKGKAPPGYQTFMRASNADPYMAQRLSADNSGQETGNAGTSSGNAQKIGGKGRQKQEHLLIGPWKCDKKRLKNMYTQQQQPPSFHSVRFKPVLWN